MYWNWSLCCTARQFREMKLQLTSPCSSLCFVSQSITLPDTTLFSYHRHSWIIWYWEVTSQSSDLIQFFIDNLSRTPIVLHKYGILPSHLKTPTKKRIYVRLGSSDIGPQLQMLSTLKISPLKCFGKWDLLCLIDMLIVLVVYKVKLREEPFTC